MRNFDTCMGHGKYLLVYACCKVTIPIGKLSTWFYKVLVRVKSNVFLRIQSQFNKEPVEINYAHYRFTIKWLTEIRKSF